MMTKTEKRYATAQSLLQEVEQTHVLAYYEELGEAQRKQLLDQIESVDWSQIASLVEKYVRRKPELHLPEQIEPAPWYPYVPNAELEAKYQQARERGEELVRKGAVAAFTVAGGQGTRLGWDAPKGTFPSTPLRKASLFQCLAEYILKVQEKYNCIVPWYIMTSPINDAATRSFFAQHNNFGVEAANVMFFPQEMMPGLDIRTGKVLMADKGEISLAPNGHGGSLKALYASGAIADMKKRGIEQISYVQIDNPIVKVIDPLFIGLHDLDGAQMSSKMLPKSFPKEKLGNLCKVGGKVTVIEYSDLPDELAELRTDDGELRFRAGSIALHVIRRDFVESLGQTPGGFGLPFHRAEKKMPYYDSNRGESVTPDEPNAVKLEMFVFDALPLCDTSIVYETDRIEEFAPIKNAEGVDSPASSEQIQVERNARWLSACGISVPRKVDGEVDAVIEITPLTAIESHDLEGRNLPTTFTPGSCVLL